MELNPDPVVAALVALGADGVERRWLDRGSRMLSWVEAGAGESTIVLEAGAMSPVVSYAAVFTALVPDHRVIAYDRAGYGFSDPVPFGVDQQVGDLLAVLEAVGPKPCVAVGHSWGGLLIQLAAWQRPDLISGLVLIDPADERLWMALDSDTFVEIATHPSRVASAGDDPRSAGVRREEGELADDIGRSVQADLDVVKLVVDACRSYLKTDEQLFAYLDELPAIFDELNELVAQRANAQWPRVPTILLTATKDRPAESTKTIIPLHEEVCTRARGRHIVVPDAGHYIHVDKPELVIACIRDVVAASPGD